MPVSAELEQERVRTSIIWHPDIFLHDKAANHVAMADNRISFIFNKLNGNRRTALVRANPATREQLELAHASAFIDHLYKVAPTKDGEYFEFNGETVMNRHTLRTLLLSAGAACQAVEEVMAWRTTNAFCVGYAGHHATANTAQGFCFTNPVAIAAKYALQQGIQRLAILDIDTHSGNGTIDIFLEPTENVLFAETYQVGYPYYQMPKPQPEHIWRRQVDNAKEFRAQWIQLLAKVRDFSPELILVSAGFDAHKEDPLTQIGIDDVDYAWLAKAILEVSPSVVAVLEGGYNLESTGRSANIFISQLVAAGE